MKSFRSSSRSRSSWTISSRSCVENANGLRAETFALRSGGNGLAIVVGHTLASPGASGGPPINQSESPWNKDLASKIKAACSAVGVEFKIFFRDNLGISRVQQVSD